MTGDGGMRGSGSAVVRLTVRLIRRSTLLTAFALAAYAAAEMRVATSVHAAAGEREACDAADINQMRQRGVDRRLRKSLHRSAECDACIGRAPRPG